MRVSSSLPSIIVEDENKASSPYKGCIGIHGRKRGVLGIRARHLNLLENPGTLYHNLISNMSEGTGE